MCACAVQHYIVQRHTHIDIHERTRVVFTIVINYVQTIPKFTVKVWMLFYWYFIGQLAISNSNTMLLILIFCPMQNWFSLLFILCWCFLFIFCRCLHIEQFKSISTITTYTSIYNEMCEVKRLCFDSINIVNNNKSHKNSACDLVFWE